jgi:hypothetical protein
MKLIARFENRFRLASSVEKSDQAAIGPARQTPTGVARNKLIDFIKLNFSKWQTTRLSIS